MANIETMQDALHRAKEAVGGTAKLARALSEISGADGITKQAISQWRKVPAERVILVERVSGVPRHDLRPDLYPVDSAEKTRTSPRKGRSG